jgi:hypothetical protein
VPLETSEYITVGCVYLKKSIFWVIIPSSPLKVNQCNQNKKPVFLLCASYWLLALITPSRWSCRWYSLPQHPLTYIGQHSIISQKTEFFIVTPVLSSDPIYAYFTDILPYILHFKINSLLNLPVPKLIWYVLISWRTLRAWLWRSELLHQFQ